MIDKMHKSLSSLPVLPMRSWMNEVIIEDKEQVAEKKPCALGCGDCSDLKKMLETMCGMKPAPSNPGMSGFSNVKGIEKKSNVSLKRSAPCDKKGTSKRRRERSPRRSRSRSRRTSK